MHDGIQRGYILGPGAQRLSKNPWKSQQNLPSKDRAGLDEEYVSGDQYEPKNKEPSRHVLFCARLPGSLHNVGGMGIGKRTNNN